jgi:hypothetical protein
MLPLILYVTLSELLDNSWSLNATKPGSVIRVMDGIPLALALANCEKKPCNLQLELGSMKVFN